LLFPESGPKKELSGNGFTKTVTPHLRSIVPTSNGTWPTSLMYLRTAASTRRRSAHQQPTSPPKDEEEELVIESFNDCRRAHRIIQMTTGGPRPHTNPHPTPPTRRRSRSLYSTIKYKNLLLPTPAPRLSVVTGPIRVTRPEGIKGTRGVNRRPTVPHRRGVAHLARQILTPISQNIEV
jgi:hypothetical protein